MAKGLPKLLAMIGGLVVVVFAVLALLRIFLDVVVPLDFWPSFWGYSVGSNWLNPVIALVVGLLVLISTGTIKSSSTKVRFNGVTVLILGILAFVFGDNLGGILVIIGGILLLI